VRGRHLDERLIILRATSPEAQWKGKGWTGVLETRSGWRESTPTRRTLNCLICTRPTRSSPTALVRLGTRFAPKSLPTRCLTYYLYDVSSKLKSELTSRYYSFKFTLYAEKHLSRSSRS
jgi:hypothetical protein